MDMNEKMKNVVLRDKMVKHFHTRTKMHTDHVRYWSSQIVREYPEFVKLLQIVKVHDASKYESPEYEPYLYTNWFYKCQKDGIDWEIPDDMKSKTHEATVHHVLNNKHHPEYWSGQTENIINPANRDGVAQLIDGTKMPLIYVAEMVADWFSVATERGTNPRDWADSNVNIRWKFTGEQTKLIYNLIDTIWES